MFPCYWALISDAANAEKHVSQKLGLLFFFYQILFCVNGFLQKKKKMFIVSFFAKE